MVEKNIVAGSMTASGVQVTPLGHGLYRLEEEACLFLGAETDEEAENLPRYADVIRATEVDPETIRLEGVHERAPFKRYLFVVSEAQSRSDSFEGFLKQVAGMGGNWSLQMGGACFSCRYRTRPISTRSLLWLGQ